MKRYRSIIFIILIISSPVLIACSQDKSGAENGENSVKEFTIQADALSFFPDIIHVTEGDEVKIILENNGGFHDFTIDKYDISIEPIMAGQSAEIKFTADKSGEFDFYCRQENHRSLGQRGTFIVDEK